MQDFEPLIGSWHGDGVLPIEPPVRLARAPILHATIETAIYNLALFNIVRRFALFFQHKKLVTSDK